MLCIFPYKTLDGKHCAVSLPGIHIIIITNSKQCMFANIITTTFFIGIRLHYKSEVGFVVCTDKLLNPLIHSKITCQPTEILQSCYFKPVSMNILF